MNPAGTACSAPGLGTVLVGAFDDAPVRRLLGLPPDAHPPGLMPVGAGR